MRMEESEKREREREGREKRKRERKLNEMYSCEEKNTAGKKQTR